MMRFTLGLLAASATALQLPRRPFQRRCTQCAPARPRLDVGPRAWGSGSQRAGVPPRDVARHAWGGGGWGGFPPPRPPGGGFNLGALLPIALIIAFPGFFFGLFNTFFLAALILPPLLSFGFNFWKERNVIEAPCPQCGQLAAGLKGQGFTQCFVCGSQLSLRGDEWRLRSKYEDGPQAGGSKYGKVDNGVIDVESDEVIDV